MGVIVERLDAITVITLDRPQARNAVDRATADALSAALREFEEDPQARVAVLTGSGRRNRLQAQGDGPMGPSRMQLRKPLIAAIEGHAVAGGLELALLADLRVMAADAVLGVFCRRFGVPLIDGGSVRLPRLIGQGRALDLILTGRPVHADEALQIGLVSRVVAAGRARAAAEALAAEIAAFPPTCLLADRASVHAQWDLPFAEALANEFAGGMAVLESGETEQGAKRFSAGDGRHGRF